MTLIVVAGIGVGAIASAGDRSPRAPKGVVPSGIPKSNIHFGNEVVVWGNNDDYVAAWNEWMSEVEAEAAAALEAGNKSEYEGHLRTIERLRQDIEALCALPVTAVC